MPTGCPRTAAVSCAFREKLRHHVFTLIRHQLIRQKFSVADRARKNTQRCRPLQGELPRSTEKAARTKRRPTGRQSSHAVLPQSTLLGETPSHNGCLRLTSPSACALMVGTVAHLEEKPAASEKLPKPYIFPGRQSFSVSRADANSRHRRWARTAPLGV